MTLKLININAQQWQKSEMHVAKPDSPTHLFTVAAMADHQGAVIPEN